jgi:UDP-N-acetylmuramoyl-tripeptide--D-alanyl-D-alanine ligase
MKPTPLTTIASTLGIQLTNEIQIHGACIDSRLAKKGDLFFALSGHRSQGHEFLADVAKKGAAAAVVREDYDGDSFGLPLLKVPDVTAALQELARRTLEKRGTKVVAITGSMGKTTTKEFTAELLATKYRLTKSPLSYNSKVTLPLSILMGSEDDEILVLEMGMSEKGEIAKLISIAPPDIALLTTVTFQHSTGFPEGLEGIAREKGSVFSHPKTALGIFCKEVPFADEIKAIGTCTKKTFSIDSTDVDLSGVLVEGGIMIAGHTIPVNLPMRAHYHNFLGAVAIARALNVSWEEIKKVAPHLKLPPMRFQEIIKSGIHFINDAYNANPEAVMAALKSLPKPGPSCKTIAVLSEMNALGVFTEEGHAKVAKAALPAADILLCLGKHCLTMKKIWENEKRTVFHFETKEELASSLKKCANPGDVVLIKGARAWALEELLNHF